MADIVTIAQEELVKRGKADASALAARSVSGDADGTELIDKEDQIPTWRQRNYSDVPIGTPYRWNGQVYKLWQQHDATGQPDWSPDQAISLWDICHTTDPNKAKLYVTPQGTRGMYQVDDCCIENNKVWRCNNPNTVYSPSEYPSYWTYLFDIPES